MSADTHKNPLASMARLTVYTDELRTEVTSQSNLNSSAEKIIRRIAQLSGKDHDTYDSTALIAWIGNELIEARQKDGLPLVTLEDAG